MGLFRFTGRRNAVVAATLFVVFTVMSLTANAQTYRKGQHIEPAYEGWKPLEDGSFVLVFGYHNENWEEELDIPVGPSNFFSPGLEDRGQPTHFLPRRNRFTFEVPVPADFGDRELAWTITANGVTKTAYGTLARDYIIDNVVIASETGSLGAGTSSPESRSNLPPVVTVLGDRVGDEVVRTVRVGEPLILEARVDDDGLPRPRTSTGPRTAESELRRMMRPPTRVTVGKTNGLFLSWNVYRGEGSVTFDPPQVKPWEDTRTSANSPWGALWVPPPVPENGVYETSVIFDEPGTYVLWARADDGGLFHDQYVTVNVLP
ncbi:MAG: hypothetical protein Q8L60_08745 [Gammaproteobacteria bacterium]|nr:hypothetical protein [Gammaproteobacteria bacterium]MDP2348135.1 hypothetical protein [Gammaproteobacteria bacterium]